LGDVNRGCVETARLQGLSGLLRNFRFVEEGNHGVLHRPSPFDAPSAYPTASSQVAPSTVHEIQGLLTLVTDPFNCG
jgi:hypothetical protein